jgi:hypothetical protein
MTAQNTVIRILFFEARKATGAFLVAAAGALATSCIDQALTGGEIVAALGVGLAAAAAVYRATNTPAV